MWCVARVTCLVIIIVSIMLQPTSGNLHDHPSPLSERCGSVVVSTSAWHAIVRGSIPARTRRVILGVKTWLSTLDTSYLLWGVVAQ